ncbi:MAG TPA: MFS transporter [Chloroflexia bacterium]|nr:MFS transporter [Chloroflexia bacterium]
MRKLFGGLWRETDFMKLWTGRTVSELGSHITASGLPILAALLLGASPLEMGLLASAGAFPVIVVGLFAGVWADRLTRRPIMIAADFGRAVLLLSIPLAYLIGVLSLAQLLIVAALAGILNIFFEVASQSYLPSLVKPDQLLEGNSKLAASLSLAEIGGPPLAGLLIQLLTAPLAILFDALSFLFSAFSLGLIRKPEISPARPEAQESIWREVREGLEVILKHPFLRVLTFAGMLESFFGGFFHTLYIYYTLTELGLSPAFIGLTVAAGGAGALLGAFYSERFAARLGPGLALVIAAIISSLFNFGIPLAGGSVFLAMLILLAIQFCGDIFGQIYRVIQISLQQQLIPARSLGKANASIQFLTGSVMPFGLLAGGVLGDLIGAKLTLFIAALGILLVAFILFFSPLRKLRHFPDALTEEAIRLEEALKP